MYPVVGNKILRFYMKLYDVVSLAVVKKKTEKNTKIKKLLLRNPAALGDTWYTLRLANAIKEKNPNIKIGMLVGSWSADMVRLCSDISYVHVEDHPMMDRRNKNAWTKIKCWYDTRKFALEEIKKVRYDAAVDCYYYFPSAARLLYKAGIPIRIGYDSREGIAYYNILKHWELKNIHNIEYQSELLKPLGVDFCVLKNSKVRFNNLLDRKVIEQYIGNEKYIVISVGTGAPMREWSKDKWIILIKEIMLMSSYRIILVGAGNREKSIIDYILHNLHDVDDNVLSLCDKLSIQQLIDVIQSAVLFIGVDSFAGHIAATYKVPQISIMHGSNNTYHWQPFGNDNCCVVERSVACSPCYFPSMCKNRNLCMDISVESVLEKIKQENYL